jgi:LPS-assembly protein
MRTLRPRPLAARGALLAAALLGAAALAAGAEDRVRTEIPYQDGTVTLLSDFQERMTRTRYRAKGRVEITYQDMVVTADEAEYDEESRQGLTRGPTRFSQGKQWLTASSSEFDFLAQTALFRDASGFTDQQFLIEGRTIRKVARDRYVVEQGFMTACQEKTPKWSFRMSRAAVRVDRTARLRNTTFRLRSIPVLYVPYVVLPLESKERSSGLLPFHTGSSSSRGRLFSLGYFQTLGPSADLTLYGDYFTERGLATGGILRFRPNPQTRLYLLAYGIHDRLDQGGAHLIVDGESRLPNDFRAVASTNITTNFRFRQAFADTFRSATVPQERSVLFLTRNHLATSTNIAFQRDEVLFPGRSLVIRHAPVLEFDLLEQPLGRLLALSLRAAVEGISRVDGESETPSLVQRLDLFPELRLRLPSLAGFSLIPSFGARETYYSARLDTSGSSPRVEPQSLHRGYGEFTLDLRAPTLERSYQAFGGFKHVIEPAARYRRIDGIDRLSETIRFDEHDAIADTDEVEYGIVNRFFRSRETAPGVRQSYEFLAVSATQKYYFDPTFGGAFRPGESNMFYPLDTVTGFSLASIQRALAPTNLSVRVTPTPGISYDARGDYDSRLDRFRDISLSTLWQREKLFLAGTYFKTEALEVGAFRSNHIQGQVGYGSTQHGLSGSVTLSYNIETSKLLNSHSRLNYVWACCGVSLEFQQFDLGLRSESRFSFSFTLKGIGSFGNIKRPESLF